MQEIKTKDFFDEENENEYELVDEDELHDK